VWLGGLVVALLAGCSQDEPPASTLPPLSVAPSPSATSAEPVPSAAQAATPQGAAEFARFFYGQVAAGFQTQNPDLVAEISLPTCESCQRYIQSIADVKRDALRVEGGDFEITFASAPALEDPQKARVDVGWDFSSVAYFDVANNQVDSGPAVTGVEETMLLQRRGGSWVVEALFQVRKRP